MTMAEALQHFIASRYDGRNLPVTLVLPDGARVPLSTAWIASGSVDMQNPPANDIE